MRFLSTILGVVLLCFPGAGGADEPFRPAGDFTLLQINDVYSTIPVEGGKAGGLARVATLVEQARRNGMPVETIIAGDFLSPSVASGVFRGEQMVAALNASGVTLGILGNHEFDFGLEVLRQRLLESRWQWVNANVLEEQTGEPLAGTHPYLIRQYGRLKVGYLGLCLASEEISRDKLRGLRIVDPLEAAAKYLPALQREGATAIVAITHLNYGDDVRLARRFPEIDLIVGGHEHVPIVTAVNRALISKAGSDARFVARLVLRSAYGVLEKNYALLPVGPELAEAPAVAQVVAAYEDRLSRELDVAIGSSRVEMDAVAHRVRSAECSLGNFIADAMRENVSADVALLNAGSIRGDRVYPAGPIRRRDVVAIQPFGGFVCKVEVTGKVLLAAIDAGCAKLPEAAGRFPQVSGLSCEVDPTARLGNRVRQVRVNGQALDPVRVYTVAITDYMLKGGDGYSMFETNKVLVDAAQGDLLVHVIEKRVRASGEIAPRVEGRLRMVSDTGASR